MTVGCVEDEMLAVACWVNTDTGKRRRQHSNEVVKEEDAG